MYNQKLLMSGLLILFVLSHLLSMNDTAWAQSFRYHNPLEGRATRRVEPKYPEEAKKNRIKGKVIVELTVDEEGNVMLARALNGHKLLKSAAIEAAKGWRFTPTQWNGKPVKIIGTITFVFKDTKATK